MAPSPGTKQTDSIDSAFSSVPRRLHRTSSIAPRCLPLPMAAGSSQTIEPGAGTKSPNTSVNVNVGSVTAWSRG